MKNLSLLVTFTMIALCSAAQTTTANRDSLYQLLNTHPEEDSQRVKWLYGICYYEIKIDHEKTKKLATEALRISKAINFQKGIGWSQKYLGSYYRETGNYAEASRHAFEMLRAFEGTSNAKGWGQAYQFLGILNQEARNPDKAAMYHQKSIEVFQRANLKLDLSFAYNSLGALYIDLQQYDTALKYQFKSLALRQELKYEDHLFIYANIATTYVLKGDYDHALEYFRKELPRMQNSYNKSGAASAYLALGDLYQRMGDYPNAERFMVKAIDLVQGLRHHKILSEAYLKFTRLEKERKNYKQALAYQELSDQYKDSIFAEIKVKQMAELEARYQSEQKDQAIQSLRQQRQIQNLKQGYLFGSLLVLMVIFVVLFIVQRSHHKKVNALLDVQRALNNKLQDADKVKSKFFANISHEFRTPLTLILAPIDAKLASARLNPFDRKSFQLIRRNALRLLTLINQLLDLSKLDARKMELSVQSGDLEKFISILAASFDSLAERRGIQFQKQIQLDKKENWYDADKLEKIINNLLFNAIKFTPAGGTVTLQASTISSTDIEITVMDTGRGIPKDEQEYIFSPFYQSRYWEDEDQQGTGLGLSLVKELVKLYGGTLSLDSEVDKGTTLSMVLPSAKEQFPIEAIQRHIPSWHIVEGQFAANKFIEGQNTETDEVASSSQGTDSILIIEDSQDLREYIASLLKDDYSVLTAKDGEEGFVVAAEQMPSLILSDIMMPKLNGIELTEKIKTDERTSHIPVVLLTAKADESSKIEGLQTGADDYLAKPFSIAELKVRISNLIEQRKKLALLYRVTLAEPAALPTAEPSMDEKFLARVRRVVEAHMSDNSFGVEAMAQEVHLSRAQLFRKLKAIANVSPNEFINEMRLQKAAELIRLRVDGLTQISYQVGYNEQSYFAKRFRKKFGVTPSEYQAKHAITK
jgi:signal transduction histidine kinase/DNA-binding response OmpR family regulator